jgi:hypothetical protein
VLVVLVQQPVASSAALVLKRRRVEGLRVSVDPVVDALPGDAERPGDVGGGTSTVELQDGEGTPQEAGIGGRDELTPESSSLPGSQVKPAHALLLDRRSWS